MTETTDVIQFRKAFGLPIHEKPTPLTTDESLLHLNLVREELEELIVALADEDITEVFDALIDLKYVITGMGAHMGLPMDEGWKEVHRSNCSKLDELGRPVFREDGKVLKSGLFSEPDLGRILREVSNV